MDYKNFFASLKQIAPMHKAEATQIWIDFAVECVSWGQYVNFNVTEDKSLAVEEWLDVLYKGFYAVKKGFGEDVAEKVIGLSCEKCCLYPGEMMQAAVLLGKGCDANDIMKQIESGELDPPNLFSPISREEALGLDGPGEEQDTSVPRPSVLNRLEHLEHDSPLVKREITKERGAER